MASAILTEAGDRILTESGDVIIIETSAPPFADGSTLIVIHADGRLYAVDAEDRGITIHAEPRTLEVASAR
jgi:hypothetical protein